MNLRDMLVGEVNRMDSVYRYGTYRVQKRESVAEHVCQLLVFATFIAAELEDQGIEVDWRRLTVNAVLHDLGEVLTGDMNGPFKKTLDGESRSFVHCIELEAIQEIMLASGSDERVLKGLTSYYANNADPLIRFCDSLCVLSYMLQEKEAGNLFFISRVHDIGQTFRMLYQLPEMDFLKAYISEAVRVSVMELTPA